MMVQLKQDPGGDESAAKNLIIGRISGVFGVKGWLKVFSYTDPKQQVLQYPVWHLQIGNAQQVRQVVTGKAHGKGIIVQLANCEDRDVALGMVGATINISRNKLPQLPDNQYYWADLIGLQVINLEGVVFGRIDTMMDTGANDVIIVRGDRERLVPFVLDQVVHSIDLAKGQMIVDWDAEF